jgi:hypothetical protein
MNTESIQKKFQKIEADFELRNELVRGDYTVDVRGGKFIIRSRQDLDISVIDVDPEDRHILLNISMKEGHRVEKAKWLCGHDERDWFVAAVPGNNSKNIWEAKQSLKPAAVRAAESAVPTKKKQRRKNKARVRQGEWFFIPVDMYVADYLIHKDEPISRGAGSKPHIVEEVYRTGGKAVWTDGTKILTLAEYEAVPQKDKWRYRSRTMDATVYGRGYVKHHDHATIYLDGWHMILMNEEARAARRQNLVFLD